MPIKRDTCQPECKPEIKLGDMAGGPIFGRESMPEETMDSPRSQPEESKASQPTHTKSETKATATHTEQPAKESPFKDVAVKAFTVVAAGIGVAWRGLVKGATWANGKRRAHALKQRQAKAAKAEQAQHKQAAQDATTTTQPQKKKRGSFKKKFAGAVIGCGVAVWVLNEINPDDLKVNTDINIDLSNIVRQAQSYTGEWVGQAETYASKAGAWIEDVADTAQSHLKGTDAIIDFARGVPMDMGGNAFNQGVSDAIVGQFGHKCSTIFMVVTSANARGQAQAIAARYDALNTPVRPAVVSANFARKYSLPANRVYALCQ